VKSITLRTAVYGTVCTVVWEGGAVRSLPIPINIIRKGQIKGVGKGDIQGQVRFVSSLFMIAA
jgi:hypothetical protein